MISAKSSLKRIATAAAVLGFCASHAAASVVLDAGAIFDGQPFGAQFGSSNSPPLYVDFSVTGVQDVNLDLTIKDSGKGDSGPITGTLAFYTCAANCNLSTVPTGTLLPSTLVSLGPVLGSGNTETQTVEIDAILGTGNYFAEFIKTSAGTTTDHYSGQFSVSSAVPESSTWAMMILGFATVGFLAYRRRDTGLRVA
jgi:hypothetical protein